MINTISAIFQVFFRLCVFRYKPQDLPRSIELLLVCLVLYTAINIILALNASSIVTAVSVSLLETLFVCLITVIILGLGRRLERWVKTLMAITGAGCVIGTLALPLFFLMFVAGIGGGLQALVLILYLVLIIWNIVIMGHILRHSLETSLGVGILFAIIYIVLTSVMINYLVPHLEM